jgi:hypothetical protein
LSDSSPPFVDVIFGSGQSFDDPDGVEAGEALRIWSPAIAYLFDQPGMRGVRSYCWGHGWHPFGPDPTLGEIPEQFHERLHIFLQWAEDNDEINCCESAENIKRHGCYPLPNEWVRVNIDAEFGLADSAPRPPGTICFYPCRGQCIITQQIDLRHRVIEVATSILLEMTKPGAGYELRWLRPGDPGAEWLPLSEARWRMLRHVKFDASEIEIDGQAVRVRVFRRAAPKAVAPHSPSRLQNLPTESIRAMRRARGPRPIVRPRVEGEMRADLEFGRMSPNDLQNMKQIAMQARYKASAEICRGARASVLSEIVGD